MANPVTKIKRCYSSQLFIHPGTWTIPLDQAGLDGVTWQRSSPNRKSFSIPGKESLSMLPMSGSQGHEGGNASGLSVLQKQKKTGRNT